MNAIGLPIPDAAVLAGAVLVALALDLLFGEPPARLHPVVAMGQYLGAVGRRVSRAAGELPRPGAEFWGGTLGWCGGAMLVAALAWVAGWAMQTLHPLAEAVLLGALLKPMLSWRMLRDEVWAVEAALAESLAAGRQRVGWLVSRDVTHLSETQVREAAVSTLAENLNDSVVAPLFWFAIAGLPGAALYRFANTADAMWGYQGERGGRDWTWAGKWAARVDDALSWLPARFTALLIALPTVGRDWSAVVANAGRTPSPNGGWPMGALAVGLGIRLGKPGVYELNAQGRVPHAADTAQALRRCSQVVLMLALLASMVVVLGGLT
ncbi:MAG TPA: adenosylcobinamide-phosphate synthase CbiB [Hydrogenophaga sp.]|uniref:adenosylcobinamide-phosphate synthase CbiB n=1 Tax=Hydrogenophaga sp. TaxID=1904254 RepID=UPI002BF4DDE1|nr:adenosylcobinamide-phosphate synthase CbiB [Hydrogenophaga sp.]HMN92328.1 adenosylcobinamide-phosphate synthase CbiB [Hydrogenophaga sp.]HMP11785.1 adenosylcobinamide-phosphate synthase CbiB [Hydrogenophaga sp.]